MTTNEMKSKLPAIVGVRDLAKQFNVRDQTIREWARTGVLPPPLAGFPTKRWRVEDLNAFFEQQAQRRA